MTTNPTATAAYFAATADGPFDHQRDAYEQGWEDGVAALRATLTAAFDRGKIEWLIHALDLIDGLARSKGMDTSTDAQDDLRKLADIVDPPRAFTSSQAPLRHWWPMGEPGPMCRLGAEGFVTGDRSAVTCPDCQRVAADLAGPPSVSVERDITDSGSSINPSPGCGGPRKPPAATEVWWCDLHAQFHGEQVTP